MFGIRGRISVSAAHGYQEWHRGRRRPARDRPKPGTALVPGRHEHQGRSSTAA